jgi:hypothetical protein
MNSESPDAAGEEALGPGFRMEVALPRVYWMLCGMSIELLLKAVIVASAKQPESTHNLKKLASDAGVTYTSEQIDLLQILTESIVWDGRYPVPNKKVDWDNLRRLEDSRLFDKSPLGNSGLEVLTRNDALNWDSYSDLWMVAFLKLTDVADWIER